MRPPASYAGKYRLVVGLLLSLLLLPMVVRAADELLPPLEGRLSRPFTADEARASGHWKKGSRDLPYFGAERNPTGRQHAGVDLYPAAGAGAPVRAMADGVVLVAAPFYTRRTGEVTWGLLVDHGSFVVNYAEIHPLKAAGDRVGKGELLGKVSGTAQLHLELYAQGVKRWIGGWYGPRPEWLRDPTEMVLKFYPVGCAGHQPTGVCSMTKGLHRQ